MKFLTAAISALVASQAAAQHFEIRIGNADVLDENSTPGDIDRAFERLLSKYETECSVISKFEGSIYVVPDPSRAPKEIAWAMDFLDEYWKTDDGGDLPYPGDFDRFMHRDGFRIIRVDYKNLPWAVRKYREELLAEGKAMERKFIAEIDGVAFFAPGVIKWLAPLFAGSDIVLGQDSCQDELTDITNFHNKKASTADTRFTYNLDSIVQIGDKISVDVRAEKQTLAETDSTVGDL